jgi:predicted RNA methylase
MSSHRVRVSALPSWLDAGRLLGDGDWEYSSAAGVPQVAEATLDREAAADLVARLRGVGLGGALLHVDVKPPLDRKRIRDARTEDARRRRDTSAGFSKEGARLDDEGRMSLTPEVLALQVGERANRCTVIDAGCGVGGNAIGFARAGCHVLAVDRDSARLDMAAHNARLYGVEGAIDFIEGDAVAVAGSRDAELLFVDPPWGASWDRARTQAADFPLLTALLSLRSRFERLWVKLPPSFAPDTLAHQRVDAVFGEAPGDFRRVKFLLVEL